MMTQHFFRYTRQDGEWESERNIVLLCRIIHLLQPRSTGNFIYIRLNSNVYFSEYSVKLAGEPKLFNRD